MEYPYDQTVQDLNNADYYKTLSYDDLLEEYDKFKDPIALAEINKRANEMSEDMMDIMESQRSNREYYQS